MEKLIKIQENVENLLREKPLLRSLKTRREFIWEYYKKYEGLVFGISKELFLYRLSSMETISRAIRKCQEENPNLRASEEDEIWRHEEARSFAKFHKKNTEKIKQRLKEEKRKINKQLSIL